MIADALAMLWSLPMVCGSVVMYFWMLGMGLLTERFSIIRALGLASTTAQRRIAAGFSKEIAANMPATAGGQAECQTVGAVGLGSPRRFASTARSERTRRVRRSSSRTTSVRKITRRG